MMLMSPPKHRKLALRRNRTVLRAGFTLIELLVVITIILTLTAVTIASFNYSINADRVRSAARQFQSFLAGARDKAIYAKDVRGVRLLLDPNDNHAVSGMQYIGSPKQETEQATGLLQSDTLDLSNHNTVMLASTSTPNHWATLKNQGFLSVGSRIEIPRNSSNWFTVTAIVPDVNPGAFANPKLILNSTVASLYLLPAPQYSSYRIELSPGVLGDAQPVLFPSGIVIDLDGSRVPTSWQPTTFAAAYGNQISGGSQKQMDILFNPQGAVVGDPIGMGMLHFHFAESFDVTKWHVNSALSGRISTAYGAAFLPSGGTWPVVPADAPTATAPFVVTRDRIVATLAARSGNISVHYVNTAGATTTNPVATDPFLFAETGQVANK